MKKILIILIIVMLVIPIFSLGESKEPYNNEAYQAAITYFNQGDYFSAYAVLVALEGYSTSASYLEECERLLTTVEIETPQAAERIREALAEQGIVVGEYLYVYQAEQLETLDLSNCVLTDISGLSNFKGLIDLNLDSNAIDSVLSLKDLTSLTSLSAADNVISDITPLYGLTQLNYLNLRDNEIENIDIVGNFTQLNYLNVSDNRVESINAVRNLTELKVLDISHNKIAYIGALRELVGLEELYMVSNYFEVLTQISNLTNLRVLEVGEDYNNKSIIMPDHHSVCGLEPISNMTKLEKLTVYGGSTGDMSCFDNLTQLKELHLIRCNFDTNEYQTFSRFSELEKLTIGLGGISADQTAELLDCFPNLSYLDISAYTPEDLSFLGKYTNLEYLNISGADCDSERDIAFLADLTNLNTLIMSNMEQLGDFSVLVACENLEYLDVSYDYIKNFEYISQMTNLKTLIAEGCMLNSIEGLENLTQLEYLDISGPRQNVNNGEEWIAFDSYDEMMAFNDISNHHMSETMSLECIGDLSQLRYLDVGGIDSVCYGIFKLPNLEYAYGVYISGDFGNLPVNLKELTMKADIKHALAAIDELEYLERLDISAMYGMDWHVKMPKLVLLKELKLEGGVASCDLTNCLYMIKLERIEINHIELSSLNALQNCEALREVYCDNCRITDISGLANCNWLYEVRLEGNKIQDISALDDKQYITYLGLSANMITDISPLENCYRLYELNIGENPIENIDAVYDMPLLRDFNWENTRVELTYEMREYLWLIESRWR